MRITVALCTRNRVEKLRATLSSIASATVPAGASLDVVVVDNGSGDATPEACHEFGATGIACAYLSEPTPGKSRALNRAIRAATGDIVAFTDDDCFVDPQWLVRIVDEFTTSTDVSVVGGRVELHDPTDLRIATVTCPTRVDVSSDAFQLLAPLLIGANVAFRREALALIGDFDVRLGPGSPSNAICEDVDYVYRAHRAGLGIVYEPGILVFHAHGRKDPREIARINYGYFVGRVAFYAKHLGDAEVRRWLYWELDAAFRRLTSRTEARPSTLTRSMRLRGLVQGVLSRWGAAQ